MQTTLRGVQCALVLSALAGCGAEGPDLGRVTGTVTLDGRPLPDALVEFVPENGRPSIGVTDAEGHYELTYTRDRQGAMVGRHHVRISTYRPADTREDGTPVAGAPEQVPAAYNRESALQRDVSPGRQQIDFDLESSAGPVIQPTDMG